MSNNNKKRDHRRTYYLTDAGSVASSPALGCVLRIRAGSLGEAKMKVLAFQMLLLQGGIRLPLQEGR